MGISVWKRQLQEELSFLAMDCLPLGGPITSYCVECMPMFKDTYKVYVALKTFGIPSSEIKYLLGSCLEVTAWNLATVFSWHY